MALRVALGQNAAAVDSAASGKPLPYEHHDDFAAPERPDATIWRYMDLAKFLSLLERAALYFPRVDQLASADPFEGYYTNLNDRVSRLTHQEWLRIDPEGPRRSNLQTEADFNAYMELMRQSGQLAKAMREVTFVNSWHVLEYESAAMWSLYLRSQDGIAVQSTYQRLRDSFARYDEFPVFVGMMRYIDYDRDAIPLGQAFFPLMHKRKSFEHERELRAVIWTVAGGKNELPLHSPDVNKYRDVLGLHAAVDLDLLIKTVYVAPSAPKWVHDLLVSLLQRYGIRKPVHQSHLASSPLH